MKIQRLNKKELEEITKLTKIGKSLNEITRIVGRSKTTVYYHFRKIKGKTIKPIVLKSQDEELIGEFIGVFAGDGCLHKTKNYNYRVHLYFNKTEHQYVKDLKKILYTLFGKFPWTFDRGDIFMLTYSSKRLHLFIKYYLTWEKTGRKSHSVHLAKRDHSKEFKIGFLRGLIDSDGYLTDNKIQFATSSPCLANDIKCFLEDLRIDYHYHLYEEKRENRVNMNHISIRKNEREKFFNIIKPRELKNLNASAGI